MTPVVVGVIVAAGKSARMGQPKALLPIGNRPMLQWVVDAAEASSLDRVVVVTGHAAESVRAGIRLERAVWAHNPHPELGTMASLRAGLEAAGPADAVMKLLGDQPELSTTVIDDLVDSWDPATHRASLVHYEDGDGHPMLFSIAAIEGIIDEEGDRLLWRLMEGDSDGVYRMAVDRLAPIDVNGPGDYVVAAARLGYDPGEAPDA